MVSVGIERQISEQRPRLALRQVDRDGSCIAEGETRQQLETQARFRHFGTP